MKSVAPTVQAEPDAILQPISYADIPGWPDDDHAFALATFRRSCEEILGQGRSFARRARFGGSRTDWLEVCTTAMEAVDARSFFERSFAALKITDPERPEGLFTGYFEPEAPGSRDPSPEFPVAIYARPAELVALAETGDGPRYGQIINGSPQPFPSRQEIENGALRGRGLEIVWLRDWADAFFIHIQGSGRIRLTDGSLTRLAFAGKNGQPYTGIGGVLADRGVFTRQQMSMQSTRAWMAAHPQAARELMWLNKSFIFFQEVPISDPALGAPGAQKVALTPYRSLAVDRSIWAFGTPVWLDCAVPSGDFGKLEPFRQLMIAQDTGTAIRGHVRGDVYWGAGELAATTAGHMKSPGRMTVLLPCRLAEAILKSR